MTSDAEEAVIRGVRSAIAVSHAVRRERAPPRPATDGGCAFDAAMEQLDPRKQRQIRAITSVYQHSLRDFTRP